MSLKVYGGLLNGYKHKGKFYQQARCFVAATGRAAVVRALESAGKGGRGIKPYVRDYWSVSGKAREVEIATAEPNTLFVYVGSEWSADTPIERVQI